MKYTYASVCSGVEGCSLALDAAPPTKGEWEPIFFSEIAKFPTAVLAHHWPDVPNLGDLAKIHFNPEKKVITNGTRTIPFHRRLDLLAGGTPCQDFSVAGKRGGGYTRKRNAKQLVLGVAATGCRTGSARCPLGKRARVPFHERRTRLRPARGRAC